MEGQFTMFNRQGGWIYIDSLFGMTILVTSLMLFGGVFYFAITSASSETNYKTAITLAQQAAETLQKYDGSGKSNGFNLNQIVQQPPPINGVQFTITPTILTITDIDNNHALYPVQIDVTWSETKRQNSNNISIGKSVILTTYYYLNPNL